MLELVPWIVLATAAFALGVFELGVVAALRHTRRPRFEVPDDELPPVSLLKPLKGTEESLEPNLRAFYEQDYPAPFEVVFATTEPDDAAIAVARRVAADYPHVPTRFVLSDPDFGLNPKVANLAGALRAARYDLVLQSDANVRVRGDYLKRVVSEMIAEKASLLSSLVVGVDERSAGAAMENLQLSAMIGPSVCFALAYFKVTCVIGKTMLLRRSELATLGGIERVKDVLAEDFLLGQCYETSGKKVVLSTTPAENVNQVVSVDRFMSRHARWLKMRAVIHVPAFIADLFANPVGLGTIALVLSGFDPRFALALLALALAKGASDALVLRRVRGTPMSLRYLVYSPLKDLLLLAVWPYSAISRSVEWRGTKLRIGWGSALRPDDGALATRMVRRVLRAFA